MAIVSRPWGSFSAGCTSETCFDVALRSSFKVLSWCARIRCMLLSLSFVIILSATRCLFDFELGAMYLTVLSRVLVPIMAL